MMESSLDSRVRRTGVLLLGKGEVSRSHEVKWLYLWRMDFSSVLDKHSLLHCWSCFVDDCEEEIRAGEQ